MIYLAEEKGVINIIYPPFWKDKLKKKKNDVID